MFVDWLIKMELYTIKSFQTKSNVHESTKFIEIDLTNVVNWGVKMKLKKSYLKRIPSIL